MDVTRLLEADHRMVEDLFARIKDAEGEAREPLIDELTSSLRRHMELEESALYPPMARVTGEETVEEGTTEHKLARKAMDDVVRLAPDEPGFGAALDALEAGISHHVEEEEGEVFPQLRKDGTILDEVATPFMTKRVELGMPMDAGALAKSASKDELVTEAEKAGIDGAASMKKDELADALAQRMSA